MILFSTIISYFEIDKVGQNQLIYGRPEEKFSIICSTFMVRRSQLNIEESSVMEQSGYNKKISEPLSKSKNRHNKFHLTKSQK